MATPHRVQWRTGRVATGTVLIVIYSVQQIKYEILAHIKEYGGNFCDWYVGVSDDPETALHQLHGVHRVEDIWLYKQALTWQACRTVQAYFIERLNTDGTLAELGTSQRPPSVYAFRKSRRTDP